MKSKVYATPPLDMADLVQQINNVAYDIRQDPKLVKRAIRDMVRRATVCVDKGGQHVRGTNG